MADWRTGASSFPRFTRVTREPAVIYSFRQREFAVSTRSGQEVGEAGLGGKLLNCPAQGGWFGCSTSPQIRWTCGDVIPKNMPLATCIELQFNILLREDPTIQPRHVQRCRLEVLLEELSDLGVSVVEGLCAAGVGELRVMSVGDVRCPMSGASRLGSEVYPTELERCRRISGDQTDLPRKNERNEGFSDSSEDARGSDFEKEEAEGAPNHSRCLERPSSHEGNQQTA
jgi:hypothetical protein